MDDATKVELFKIYLDTAEKTSDRRAGANNWLLSANSLIASLYGYLQATQASTISIAEKRWWLLIIPIAGILMCAAWIRIIASYRKLNAAKFKVLHEYEAQVDFAFFRAEQAYYREDKRVSLSKLEFSIPAAFIISYLMLGFATLLSNW